MTDLTLWGYGLLPGSPDTGICTAKRVHYDMHCQVRRTHVVGALVLAQRGYGLPLLALPESILI